MQQVCQDIYITMIMIWNVSVSSFKWSLVFRPFSTSSRKFSTSWRTPRDLERCPPPSRPPTPPPLLRGYQDLDEDQDQTVWMWGEWGYRDRVNNFWNSEPDLVPSLLDFSSNLTKLFWNILLQNYSRGISISHTEEEETVWAVSGWELEHCWSEGWLNGTSQQSGGQGSVWCGERSIKRGGW